jgi:RNA polymerase sigma factor (sigma-70 family)
VSHEESFERLYSSYYSRLCAFLVSTGYDASDARDLAQDVFVRIYRNVDAYREGSDWPYLKTVASRLALNRMRDQNAQKRDGITTPLDDITPNVPDTRTPPDDAVIDRELKQQLHRAIDNLSPRNRESLLLYLAGYSYNEITQLLGISLPALKSRIHGAREALRASLSSNDAHPLPPKTNEGRMIDTVPTDIATDKREAVSTPPRVNLNRRLSVFLCHASQDKSRVRALCERLQTLPVDVWLDEKRLLPGQDWQYEISRAIRRADVVVVCLTPHAVGKSGFVQKEIRYALDVAEEQPEGATFIIPARLVECDVPTGLSKWHWANLYEPDGFQRLSESLRSRAAALSLDWST